LDRESGRINATRNEGIAAFLLHKPYGSKEMALSVFSASQIRRGGKAEIQEREHAPHRDSLDSRVRGKDGLLPGAIDEIVSYPNARRMPAIQSLPLPGKGQAAL